MSDIHPSKEPEALITVNPETGLVLLIFRGKSFGFVDINDVRRLLNLLYEQVESIEQFLNKNTERFLTTADADDAVKYWEEQLEQIIANTTEDSSKNRMDSLNNSETLPIGNKFIESKNIGDDDRMNKNTAKVSQITNPGTQIRPKGEANADSSASEVRQVNRNKSQFDPDEISWITPDVAITNRYGGIEAKKQGHFVINVAGEVHGMADLTIPVEPGYGPSRTLNVVKTVAKAMDYALQQGNQVVVHCAVGMERSVLCVAWYMHEYMGLSLKEAYKQIGSVRLIAADRRHWIGLEQNELKTRQED